MSEKIKILVACHKADPNIREDEVYMPIHVGKALHPDIDLKIQPDNTGDNISSKNGAYCELTAMYWGWKNLTDVQYIGLAHYRRYLDINPDCIPAILPDGGMILPRQFHCRYDNYTNLALLLTHEEAILTIDLLLKRFPDAKEAVTKYFFRSNLYSVFNMLIADKKTFDSYCSFLFPLLEELEESLQPHGYSRLKRNIGYIAEALLGFWIIYRRIPVKYVDTVDLSTDVYKNNWRTKLRNFQRDLGFRFTYLPKHQNISFYPAAMNALKGEGFNIKNP